MASIKRLKEQTVCKLCDKLLNNPRLLPCLHSYCTACLLKFKKEDEDLSCPTCFENHGSKIAPNLPKDILGEVLITSGRTGNENNTICSSCNCSEFLCSECSSIHQRMRQTRDHEIIALKELDISNEEISHRTLYCEEHPDEELRYFCEKCKQVVCRECTVIVHRNHKYKYIEQANTVKEFVERLRNLTDQIKLKVNRAEKALKDVQATTDLIAASLAGLKNSVNNTATEMVRHIRQAEEDMIADIDRIQSWKFHALKAQKKQLQNNLETFQYGQVYAEHALRYLSEVEIYQLRLPIESRLKILNTKKISRNPVEQNNLKHVRETKKGQRQARASLGYLEVNGNIVINGCVRDLKELEDFDEETLKSPPNLKGISVDIRGPGNEFLYPVKKERESPGSYGADFQSERSGIHSVLVTLDGLPVTGTPIEVEVGTPELSPSSSTPLSTSSRSFGRNPRKPRELWDVHGIAIGLEGQIVVTDSICHRIQIFDNKGRLVRMFGSLGIEDSQFNSPQGVAITKQGNILIADNRNARIQIINNDCNFLRSICCHDDDDKSFHPYDVTLDQEGNIIALERDKSKVRIYTSQGDVITDFGSVGSGDGQFINPCYITVNKNDHIIVSDLGNDRVQAFTNTGQFLFKFGRSGEGYGEFCWPTGIAVKGNGDIIVADSCNSRIQTFRADGCFVSCLGTRECSVDNRLKSPQGLAVDDNDVIYVADWGNNRVQIY